MYIYELMRVSTCDGGYKIGIPFELTQADFLKRNYVDQTNAYHTHRQAYSSTAPALNNAKRAQLCAVAQKG